MNLRDDRLACFLQQEAPANNPLPVKVHLQMNLLPLNDLCLFNAHAVGFVAHRNPIGTFQVELHGPLHDVLEREGKPRFVTASGSTDIKLLGARDLHWDDGVFVAKSVSPSPLLPLR